MMESEERGWAMAAHLLPLAGFSFFGPLIIWLIKKDVSEFVEDQARESLNFQLTLLVGVIIGICTSFIGVGVLLLIFLSIFMVIIEIIATVKVNQGERYRYPLCIRFI
ncbi:DUF4870 domain-containing protein [Candidatus Sumerlaeota bacterium]|nr:DUF4870 domain-containing protein [Candidatus Sumerlaeota bacterium]